MRYKSPGQQLWVDLTSLLVRKSYPVDENADLKINCSLTYEAIVFNNKTFTMHQVFSSAEAYEQTFQPHPIDCGENILLYR